MNSRSAATLAAAIFVMTLAEFFAALGGVWIALGVAMLLPWVAFGLVRFFEVETGGQWTLGAVVVATGLGIGLATLAQTSPDPLMWAAPVIAGLETGLVLWWRNRSSVRCGLCNTRLAGEVSFVCPRCSLVVCEQRCWDFEKLRCRLCVQNRVPVFPPDSRWWNRNFGAATPHGRCQLCQSTAEQAELRNCPNCGRPQCRDCWDDSNGTCSRCGWRVQALPESLKAFM